MDRSRAVAEALAALKEHGAPSAAGVITRAYPFTPMQPARRVFRVADAMAVFVSDGFIDRYSGARLIFPGALRLLSDLLPTEFPYHPNWKTADTHPAYWELCPTIDHVVPVSRGGVDNSSNWVTTSMLQNSAKGNWMLEELGWRLYPPGDMDSWDGLLGLFLEYTGQHPEVGRAPDIRKWHRAAVTEGARSTQSTELNSRRPTL